MVTYIFGNCISIVGKVWQDYITNNGSISGIDYTAIANGSVLCLSTFLRPPPDISNKYFDNSYMLRLIFMKLGHNAVWLCPQIMHDL